MILEILELFFMMVVLVSIPEVSSGYMDKQTPRE